MIKTSILSDQAGYTDLYFALCTPLAERNQLVDAIFTNMATSQQFCFGLVKKIIKKMGLFSIEENGETVVELIKNFFEQHKKNSVNLEIAKKVYCLSRELKRHEGDNVGKWDSLPSYVHIFLNTLFPWSEDLSALKSNIDYQYLGHGEVNPKKDVETLTDFGCSTLFRVQPPTQPNGVHYDFALIKHPEYKIVRSSSDQIQKSHAKLFGAARTLNTVSMGHFHEMFDVISLEKEIQKGGDDATCAMNQLLDLFSCYRSALCDTLNIFVNLPLAIEPQGQWMVCPRKEKKEPSQAPFSLSMLQDLMHLFHVERMWHINVIHEEFFAPNFAVFNDHLTVNGILPLPAFFLQMDLYERHQRILNTCKLQNDSLEKLKSLSNLHHIQEQKVEKELEWLNILFTKGFSSDDFIELDLQAMLFVRLIRHLEFDFVSQNPSADLLIAKAKQLINFFNEKDTTSCPYTYEISLEARGTHFTESLLQLKKEIKMHMLLSVIHTFQKQSSEQNLKEHLIQLLQNQCDEIDSALVGSKDSAGAEANSFFIHFGEEILKEMEQILHSKLDDQEVLYHKLLLLRKTLEEPNTNLTILNKTLHSVLHDAMIKKNSQRFHHNINVIMEKLLTDHHQN